MADLLTDEEISQRLEGSEWTRDGDEIVREWEFDDFAGAIAFVNRVAESAEEANHHPDILLHGWNKVQPVAHEPLGGGLDRGSTSTWRGAFDALSLSTVLSARRLLPFAGVAE